ncbi:MAG: UDP-N-acetylglucosamine diphosphorylase/glucosamine-1-phosphate N-acetyltransferase [Acidobacteria bacterium]|nr:MAG: UDP-N-acetylglucosamine diphosphorylase/glucosamine-1-phosphate N-acetyltransferase [Acidobacteriota bacterium]
MAEDKPRIAVVLAAGKGKRMRSRRPKPLHEIAGRPLVDRVLELARRSGCERILMVVGHGAETIRAHVEAAGVGAGVDWVVQGEQRGTGHALAQVAPHLPAAATLLVLSVDVPLVRAASLQRLLALADGAWGAMAVAEPDEAGSLGRVIAGEDATLQRIVEAADASAGELATRTVNAGLYALPAPDVFAYLDRLRPDNAQGELYLTDALGLAAADGRRIALLRLADAEEALGINDRRDLARAHRVLLRRAGERLMEEGVTILDPLRTAIEPGVEVGRDTVIHPGASLLGRTAVGEGCELHQGAWVRDSVLGDGVVVAPYSVLDGAEVGDRCTVGPFARLRPQAVLLEEARVGNFVEVKKTRVGKNSKASHLTYLGDATLGDGVNVGAGVVTCNYDGERKHRTTIGDHAFIGSDTMLVAPVRVGERALTAAGSTITHDVPDDALAIGRARQRNIPDWRARKGRRRD